MCDDITEQDNARFAAAGGELNRRDITKMSAAAMFLAACTNAGEEEEIGTATAATKTPLSVVEVDVDVPMAEGVSDSYYVRPATGNHPGVLIWPDIRGLRPAFKMMGKRLAMSGYSVLVVNPFYRDMKHPVVGPDASFQDPDARNSCLRRLQPSARQRRLPRRLAGRDLLRHRIALADRARLQHGVRTRLKTAQRR